MARYQILRIGVWDSVASQRIVPQSGEPWYAYQAWLEAGNVPDPYVPPEPIPESLDDAKKRKTLSIKRDGAARMATRFPALDNFDTIQLVREVILCVAPAARQLTDDFTWVSNTYQAGKDALALVDAASTIDAVDAVSPAWPPP
jgi:hypothetical protein